MTDFVRAELLKVRTTRAWYAYLAVIVLLVGLGASGDIGSAPDSVRIDIDYQQSLVEGAGFGALLSLILGITVVTNEFRHGTITPTMLNSPRRERIVVAKAIATIMISTLFALLALTVLAVVATVWFQVLGVPNKLTEGEVLERAGQVLLSGPLWGLAGVAVGALVQSQVAALVGTLIWVFVGETLFIALLGLLDLDGVADYFPFQALDAADGTNFDLLPYGTAIVVSLGWALVLGILGTVRMRRADIT